METNEKLARIRKEQRLWQDRLKTAEKPQDPEIQGSKEASWLTKFYSFWAMHCGQSMPKKNNPQLVSPAKTP
jgi:hypothetical protein